MHRKEISVPVCKKRNGWRRTYHFFSELRRVFDDGTLTKVCVYNADETKFMVNIKDSGTMAMKEDSEIKFPDLVSGDRVMAKMVM